jgi:hypothetical protein
MLQAAAAVGSSQATTAVYACRVPVLQLWENRSLHKRLLPDQAGQLTVSSGTLGELAQGLGVGPSTTVRPSQLHRGGDSHRRGSTCGYVLPQ